MQENGFGKPPKRNVIVREENTYRSDFGVHKSLTKQGMILCNMNPPVIQKSNTTKQAKKDDVDTWLQKYYSCLLYTSRCV